jgi:DNA primase
MISPATIEQVRDLDIIQVIEKFGTPLKKQGTTHWACCPIHKEKTPSFTASFNRQTFKCFGCGEFGDGISFVQKTQNVEFKEAVQEIANSFGIHVEHDESEQAQKLVKQHAKKRELSEITKEAFKFLQSQQPKVVLLQPWQTLIDEFEIMNGLSGWTQLADHFAKKNIDMSEVAKLKLVTKSKKGTWVDVLRDCIIFPLRDERGRVVGFSKRNITPEAVEKYGKYHNPAENDLYHKSRYLYGIYQAKEAMEVEGVAYLVEGYTDVISMHMAGFLNTVGSCGTALTPEQAKLLSNYVKHVNILRDGDAAGQKAAQRDMEILLAAGLTCSLIFLPENHDPDSFILKNAAA